MKYLAPAFLWGLVILWLCAIPGQDIPKWQLLSFDKAGHAGIFFILTALTCWGLFKQKTGSFLNNHFLSISVIIAVVYGGSTELMQQYCFQNRTADLLDFIADSAGALLLIPAYFLIGRFRKA